MIKTKQLTEKEELQFIRLVKMAGYTIKQIEQEVTLSPESLHYNWKKIPVHRSPNYLKVHNRHKGVIIELILMSIDIFEIASIFNYRPKTVLRFIEQVSLDGQWQVKKCDLCKHPFVDLDRTKICQKMSCKWTQKNQKDKYRFLRKSVSDSY